MPYIQLYSPSMLVVLGCALFLSLNTLVTSGDPPGHYTCHESSKEQIQIELERVCDGKPDCPHEDDERACLKPYLKCKGAADVKIYYRGDGRLCDGVADCPEGDDEDIRICGRDKGQEWFRDRAVQQSVDIGQKINKLVDLNN